MTHGLTAWLLVARISPRRGGYFDDVEINYAR